VERGRRGEHLHAAKVGELDAYLWKEGAEVSTCMQRRSASLTRTCWAATESQCEPRKKMVV